MKTPNRRLAPVLLAFVVAFAAVLVALPASAEVTLASADERPLRHQVVRLSVQSDGGPAAGYQVVAVYRPNSQTGHSETLTAVDASGTVLWTPQDAGPVTLQVWPPGADPTAPGATPLATHTVAVRFGHFPASGMLIMVLAGLLLFGGAGAALVMLLRPDGSGPPPFEPPST